MQLMNWSDAVDDLLADAVDDLGTPLNGVDMWSISLSSHPFMLTLLTGLAWTLYNAN